MKFVVSSTELLSHLQSISKVISSKVTLPILENFLFETSGNELTLTASDSETTLITSLELENTEGEGSIALPAKLLTETLKEFPEQPLTFEIDLEMLSVEIYSENGKFSIVGAPGDDFPKASELKEEEKTTVNLESGVLLHGINKALFATAEDELRPVMNGIFFELSPEKVSFVASDAHKLVRYRRYNAKSDKESNLILAKKPAGILKNLLYAGEDEVIVEFDDRNAIFSSPDFKMICRLIEGTYPGYETVIPVENPNKLTIDRVDLMNALKRVSVFSNQASNLVKLSLTNNQLMVSAQDIDFSISAYEKLNCQYDGDEMEIGFKSLFLIEILSNLASDEVVIELSDPSKAGLILPLEKEYDDEEVLMLLMPMMINP